MTRTKTAFVILVAFNILVVVLIGWIVWRTVEDHHRSVGFERIEIGDSKNNVVEALGKADRVLTGCGYLAAKPQSDCTVQHVYFSFWGTLAGEAWVVSFDQSGRATRKAHFLSP